MSGDELDLAVRAVAPHREEERRPAPPCRPGAPRAARFAAVRNARSMSSRRKPSVAESHPAFGARSCVMAATALGNPPSSKMSQTRSSPAPRS